jgi:hypothetical protein
MDARTFAQKSRLVSIRQCENLYRAVRRAKQAASQGEAPPEPGLPAGIDEIVKDDFAELRRMIQRRR